MDGAKHVISKVVIKYCGLCSLGSVVKGHLPYHRGLLVPHVGSCVSLFLILMEYIWCFWKHSETGCAKFGTVLM